MIPYTVFIPRADCNGRHITVDDVSLTTIFTAGLLAFFSHLICTNNDMISSIQLHTKGNLNIVIKIIVILVALNINIVL